MSPYKKIFIKTKLIAAFPVLGDLYDLVDLLKASTRWKSRGWPAPAHPFVKRSILLAEALRINASNIVESGTYQGDTAWFFRKKLRSIVSIEVHPQLAALAKNRFKAWRNITIVEGDSGDVLPSICASLQGPTLFWLDGHYSGGITGSGREACPVWRELDAITTTTRNDWSAFIDDARLFGVDPAYPSIQELREYAASRCPRHELVVENDIIKISASVLA